ncbi:MAG: amiloride-sensitive sodium channel family protein [Ignavibacteria bacterium]|nr:amiloride-sensitive sodium channel family protein [Ignavibacteria bacterium]
MSFHFRYEQCGCVNPFLWNGRTIYAPKLKKVVYSPLCGIENQCFSNAIGTLLTSTSLLNDYCSECSQECIITDFIVQTSSLSGPLDWQMPEIKRFVENSSIPLPANWPTTWREEIQKNYVAIDIVRETSVVENNTQSAALGIVDVLSNVGGQTGLWIGISFLSIMELIELLHRLIQNEYYIMRQRPE